MNLIFNSARMVAVGGLKDGSTGVLPATEVFENGAWSVRTKFPFGTRSNMFFLCKSLVRKTYWNFLVHPNWNVMYSISNKQTMNTRITVPLLSKDQLPYISSAVKLIRIPPIESTAISTGMTAGLGWTEIWLKQDMDAALSSSKTDFWS